MRLKSLALRILIPWKNAQYEEQSLKRVVSTMHTTNERNKSGEYHLPMHKSDAIATPNISLSSLNAFAEAISISKLQLESTEPATPIPAAVGSSPDTAPSVRDLPNNDNTAAVAALPTPVYSPAKTSGMPILQF